MLETIGWIVAVIGWIWLVVMGFRHNIAWGILNLLIPVVAIIFGIVHFAEARTPLIIMIVGALVAGIGLVGL
jgi:hypothetical protein